MTGNYPNLDLVNIDVHTKFGLILSSLFQDIKWKRNSDINQGLKFGRIMSIHSQDIAQKPNVHRMTA